MAFLLTICKACYEHSIWHSASPHLLLCLPFRAILSSTNDFFIGRSLGAKAKNYEVLDLATNERYQFAEGSKIQDVKVFAGKGSKTPYRNAQKFADRYGGAAADWQHVKGKGLLETEDGDRFAEVHWSQCEGIGKVEFFVKEWLDEG